VAKAGDQAGIQTPRLVSCFDLYGIETKPAQQLARRADVLLLFAKQADMIDLSLLLRLLGHDVDQASNLGMLPKVASRGSSERSKMYLTLGFVLPLLVDEMADLEDDGRTESRQREGHRILSEGLG
jgi:hypothetical protein